MQWYFLAMATLAMTASVPSPKVVSIPLSKSRVFTDNSLKRETHNLELTNGKTFYKASLKVGTPAVDVQVLVDTGSADLWVGTEHFDPSKSSTWKDSGEKFSMNYLTGHGYEGELGYDTVQVAGNTIKAGEFASVTNVENFHPGVDGIFGIGYSADDYTSTGYTYKNLPALLKEQGYIESVSFSLWASDFFESDNGSLLFGGVDHSLYSGDLAKLPIIIGPEMDGKGGIFYPQTRLHVATILNGISLKNGAGEKADVVTGGSLSTTLDSGASTGVLPTPWVKALGESLGFVNDEQSFGGFGAYYTTAIPQGSIIFNFLGVELEMPIERFMSQPTNADGEPVTKDGEPVYLFGAMYQKSLSDLDYSQYSTYLLGDPFFSGAYVAYDLDLNEIGIAPSLVNNVASPNIEGIDSKGIPGTAAPDYSSTSAHTSYTTQIATIF